MKEFILHIGIHETGTTSIQSALMNYNDGETIYASALNENNSIPLGLLFYPERVLRIYKRMGKSFLDISVKFGISALILLLLIYFVLYKSSDKDNRIMMNLILIMLMSSELTQSQFAHHQAITFFIVLAYLITNSKLDRKMIN